MRTGSAQHALSTLCIRACAVCVVFLFSTFFHSYDTLAAETSLAIPTTETHASLRSKLKALDTSLALDDFGTGFSSLDYLRRYSFNTLKVDRSFIQDYLHSMENEGLIKAIIAMGEALGLKVIAEGVETSVQVEFMLNSGCSYFQGYYFSKPLTFTDFKNWLGKQ